MSPNRDTTQAVHNRLPEKELGAAKQDGMKPTKVCLLGVNFDTGNMGVNALAVGAIQTILHRWPNADIFFLDYGTTESKYNVRVRTGRVDIPVVNMRFSKKLYLENHILMLILLSLILRLIPSEGLRRRIVERNRCLREIWESDLVASIAGGDSFSDIYGFERLLYVALPQILALLLRKPLILLPQTYGPFKSAASQAVAKFILRRAQIVYSRDDSGLETARQLIGSGGDTQKVRFAYDLGFTLEPFAPAESGVIGLPDRPDNARPPVGLNVSGLLFLNGKNHNNKFGLSAEYDELTYRLIDFFIAERGLQVLLIPHVFGQEAENDTTICKRLFEEVRPKYGNSIGYADGTYNQSEIKHIIGQCDFFVGARMHACIAAISQCVPTVPIAYSDKFIGVMKTVGIDSLVADPRTMDQAAMLALVQKAYEERDVIRQQLARKMPEVKQSALQLFVDLYWGRESAKISERLKNQSFSEASHPEGRGRPQ